MRYPINRVITTKKKHACGSNQWRVIKTGAQIKIKCEGCNKEMSILPSNLDKIVKS